MLKIDFFILFSICIKSFYFILLLINLSNYTKIYQISSLLNKIIKIKYST